MPKASTPQVLTMSDVLAGTTLEELEYSEDEVESEDEEVEEVQCML